MAERKKSRANLHVGTAAMKMKSWWMSSSAGDHRRVVWECSDLCTRFSFALVANALCRARYDSYLLSPSLSYYFVCPSMTAFYVLRMILIMKPFSWFAAYLEWPVDSV